jgi:hypothetical protein
LKQALIWLGTINEGIFVNLAFETSWPPFGLSYFVERSGLNWKKPLLRSFACQYVPRFSRVAIGTHRD